jgi:hypothetical protein
LELQFAIPLFPLQPETNQRIQNLNHILPALDELHFALGADSNPLFSACRLTFPGANLLKSMFSTRT